MLCLYQKINIVDIFISFMVFMENVSSEGMAKLTLFIPPLLKKTIKKDAVDRDTTMNNRIVTILGEHYG